MATCLGIYIDKNIIKYTKVSRDKNSTKVEAYGVKIYSDLKQTINQIISETYSFKVPISINMSEEMYNYFSMSNLLNKKDLNKAIKTEFESYCYEKGFNANALESRYLLVNDANEKGKVKVIHVAVDKIKLNKLITDFDQDRLSTITPISLSIANIVPLNPKENIAVLNIEDTTTFTIITGEKVYEIRKIEIGAANILDSINQKENSYAKAYEICKNTTIYTMQGKELQEQQNEYLSDIVPQLYEIASQVTNILTESLIKIGKIYITGTASVINNIDLYFEEVINGVKCEILKPFFIEDSPKINIKDYIEVNSATALALQGLDYGLKDINFMKVKASDALAKFFTITTGNENDSKDDNSILKKINIAAFSSGNVSRWLFRGMLFTLIVFIAYTAIGLLIEHDIKDETNKIAETSSYTNKQLSLAKNDMNSVNSKITEYTTLSKKLKDASTSVTEKDSYKNTIPVLLSSVMKVIPKQVQLTSIENTSDKKIVINAQSPKYEQLAYFKARLKAEGTLKPTSVVSSAAVKENNVVKIVIEGELP